jgi:dihydroorotase
MLCDVRVMQHRADLSAMGSSLEEVVTMATSAPAKIISRAPKIGTLQIGAPGGVAIMELVEGPVSFVDTRNNKRDGKVC